jgi:YolD-like protein
LILKALKENGDMTISYFENGMLQTFTGRYHDLNLFDQTLCLVNKEKKRMTIHIAGIQQIH